MKKIGNILFDKSKEDTGLYNVCDEQGLLPGIPTLIVGWNNVKRLYPEKSIIGWKIDENTYWTYGKRERRDRYEIDLIRFKNMCIEKIMQNIEYIFFDMFLCDDDCKKELARLIASDNGEKRVSYLYNGMIYLYSEVDNVVYGIKLGDIDYEGKSSKKVLSIINANKSIKCISDVPFSIRNLFNNNNYIIPYVYSL